MSDVTAADAGTAAPDPGIGSDTAESLDLGTETVESLDPGTDAPETLDPEASAAEVTETPSDPFEEFGGRETIEAAHRLYEASRSEDGVIQLFLEAGRSLGLGLKDMETLFTGAQTPEAAEPEIDPDEPLTIGQFQELQRKAQESEKARAETAAREAARATVQSTVKDLGLDPKDPSTQVVLSLGDKYITPGDLSPESVAAAVRRGHADYVALIEKEQKAYLAKKQTKAASVPSAPAGSSAPSEPPPAEPKDTTEAIKIARRRLGIGRR